MPCLLLKSWNHKFLDYEIETHLMSSVFDAVFEVGIISFSITRLKRTGTVKIQGLRLGWNHKFLDYEIETSDMCNPAGLMYPNTVGIISFLITRLKQISRVGYYQ